MSSLPRLRTRFRAAVKQSRVIFTHPSNKGRRVSSCFHVVRYELNSFHRRATVVPFGDSLQVEAIKGGDSSSRAVFARYPDWPAMAIWRSWLRPGDTFLDVGANVGLYSLIAAERQCRVLAVEPAVDMVERLRRNIELNGLSTIEVKALALMDRIGPIELGGPDANRRVARPVQSPGALSATTIDLLVGQRQIRGVKIDVEGNERLVLHGAKKLLAEGRVDLIQLEWNDTSRSALSEGRGPVASFLYQWDFLLFQIDGLNLVGPFEPGQAPAFGDDVFAARGAAVDFLQARSWEQ